MSRVHRVLVLQLHRADAVGEHDVRHRRRARTAASASSGKSATSSAWNSRAAVEAGEAVADVGAEAGLAHLAVADDVDAGRALLRHDLGHRRVERSSSAVSSTLARPSAPRSCRQGRRAGEAPGVRGAESGRCWQPCRSPSPESLVHCHFTAVQDELLPDTDGQRQQPTRRTPLLDRSLPRQYRRGHVGGGSGHRGRHVRNRARPGGGILAPGTRGADHGPRRRPHGGRREGDRRQHSRRRARPRGAARDRLGARPATGRGPHRARRDRARCQQRAGVRHRPGDPARHASSWWATPR